jgi:hypothetical protein
MGRRDIRHKEPKKVRKDARKLPGVSVSPAPASVEVVGKKKRKGEEEE